MSYISILYWIGFRLPLGGLTILYFDQCVGATGPVLPNEIRGYAFIHVDLRALKKIDFPVFFTKALLTDQRTDGCDRPSCKEAKK